MTTLGYAYHLDAASPLVQSGRPHSILSHLRGLGANVTELFPLRAESLLSARAMRVANALRGRNYLSDRNERLLRSFGRQLTAAVRRAPPDYIFSPSTLPLVYLETSLPTVFCADAPFSAMRDYYPDFMRLSQRQASLSEQWETDVLRRASLAIYPSAWAAAAAVRDYGAAPERVATIPFGANFGRKNARAEVMGWIAARERQRQLRLLFVGRDWERKGGNTVIAAADWLKSQGVDLRLDVVGPELTRHCRDRSYIVAHGNLRASRPAEAEALRKLFIDSHFLFVPSRAEAYGMVFCEACAFGLPSISTQTGGIPSIVQDGVSGALRPLEAGGEEFGRAIRGIFSDLTLYRAFAEDAFRSFETRLNWDSFCQTFLRRTAQTLEAAPAPRTELPVELCGAPTRSLRVAYVVDKYLDPRSVTTWSGLPSFIYGALAAQGMELEVIVVHDRPRELWEWIKFIVNRFVFRARYLRNRHPALLRSYGRQIERRLAAAPPFDWIFAPGTVPIAGLETKVPVAFWVDASFGGMREFYGSFKNLSKGSVRAADLTEEQALSRSALALYSSEWAAESAMKCHGADPARTHVVPYGANLRTEPRAEDVDAAIAARGRDECRLLFAGVDWERKGAAVAIAAAGELQRRGLPVRLTVVGCRPPVGFTAPPGVEIVGFINKGSADGPSRLDRLFRESHFFILPTRAEAYGLVFCEAAAYGLPCLAPRTGGVPTIIADGVTGWLLEPEAGPLAYADRLERAWNDPAEYRRVALAARRRYVERLNWAAAGREILRLMRDSPAATAA